MDDDSLSVAQPLGHYSDVHAWVLMGDPGAGKTEVFETLSKAESGYYTTARDFVSLALPPIPVGPIFIDGLDEVTAGSTGGSTVLDAIRLKLQQSGTPKFRISCREADWRGNADSSALKRLVGSERFMELHLAPLTREQILALVANWQSSSEAAAVEFIRQAENHDLEGLLDNPQTLRLLVKAIGSKADKWPGTKTETYAMACLQLVREPNEEHQAIQQNSLVPTEQLLDAAGYLSAVMLLSGSAGLRLQPSSESSPGMVFLKDLHQVDGAPDTVACQAAIGTRLFRGPVAFAPVHRTIAEYLGARYLASRINAGLPASRVLALMQGDDAGIVPALRGLHAWLAAAVSGDIRHELIRRDPLGVVLHGDVGSFTRDEKLWVLDALRDEATRYAHFRSQNWTSHPFGALATPDMEDEFRNLLQSPDRSDANMALLDCVLDAIAHGQRMPALAPVLEQVIRENSYWPELRTNALATFITYSSENGDRSHLLQLLADVHSGAVEDLEDGLLGMLLEELYPKDIGPKDLLSYFRQSKADYIGGAYWSFWHGLVKGPGKETIPDLLSLLVERNFKLDSAYDHLGSSQVVGDWLLYGLKHSGERVSISQLFDWLSLGQGPYGDSLLDAERETAVREWLGKHPAIYKALFVYGLGLPFNPEDRAHPRLWRLRENLYKVPDLEDAEEWYVSLSESCGDDDLRKALLLYAFDLIERRQGINSYLSFLEEWAANHPYDADWICQLLTRPYPPAESEQKDIDSRIKRRTQRSESEAIKLKQLSDAMSSLVHGPAHLGLLVAIANAYLNFFRRSTEQKPIKRLMELLNHNEEWVSLALNGLRQCLFRNDLPTALEAVDLHLKGRRYNVAIPCLAAMALRWEEDAATALQLPMSILETVIAFRLTHNFGEAPAWFTQVVVQHPDQVADVVLRLARGQILAKAEHVESLYALGRDANYAPIARKITPQLIAAYPEKIGEKQRKSLRLLIVSLLLHLDHSEQLATIANRLSSGRTDVAQQAYWLAAGLLCAPQHYLPEMRAFVAKTQLRSGHVFAILQELQNRIDTQVDEPLAVQIFLIELLGPRSNLQKARSGRGGIVTPAMQMAEYVQGLISRLAGNASDAARKGLSALQQRGDMTHWRKYLDHAFYEQQIARRNAAFASPLVTDVVATLANLKPANAADLCALTVDHLTQLAAEIHHGSTNDYRQYWAGEKPNTEDVCRDALLSDLKKSLAPLGVAAEREGNYADAKRADIKIIAHPHHLPVEIKREMHPDLWTAISAQLIAKYGRETRSDGYGIYLVFWFGGNFTGVAGDGGNKPKTPQELQQRLAATVPETLKHKIAVLVVDCAKPAPSAKP